MHAIEDASEDTMPQSNFSFEVKDADHVFSLRVVAGHGKSPAV